MTEIESDWIELRSTELRARINPLGAQLSVLQDREGRDLLWNGDAAFWAGRAPFLFPIVGALAGGQYRLGTKTYALPRHGFARGKPFKVVKSEAARATFQLRADDSSLAVYPFRFELDIGFRVQAATLSVTAIIRNVGHDVMPASFGYHPAFRWPLPYGQSRASHFIEFECDEPAPVRRLDSAGLLLPAGMPTPIQSRRLMLDDALFRDDALILDQVRSRSVSYGGLSGPRIAVAFPDMPYLGVWMKPGANFICIEPWHGIADPQGYRGDFADKPGAFRVDAGRTVELRTDITLTGL